MAAAWNTLFFKNGYKEYDNNCWSVSKNKSDVNYHIEGRNKTWNVYTDQMRYSISSEAQICKECVDKIEKWVASNYNWFDYSKYL